MDTLYKLPKVIELTGLARATIYNQMKLGKFPQSVKVTGKAVAWRASDIAAWMKALTNEAPSA